MKRNIFSSIFLPAVQAGEFKVETKDGQPAAFIGYCKGGLLAFEVGEDPSIIFKYNQDGKLAGNASMNKDNLTLYIVTPEKKQLTSFEKALRKILHNYVIGLQDETVQQISTAIYGIAKKEFERTLGLDKLTFNAILRLLDMIPPGNLRAISYTNMLADKMEEVGYKVDAKLIREHVKIMQGEKVPMATMDKDGPDEPDVDIVNHKLPAEPPEDFIKELQFIVYNWNKLNDDNAKMEADNLWKIVQETMI